MSLSSSFVSKASKMFSNVDRAHDVRVGVRPKEYWVLALSKGKTRLFLLEGRQFKEITDEHFPLHYEEQFQHERKTGQIVQYYADESRVSEVRRHAYYRHVLHLLESYLQEKPFPLILMTANTNVGDFKRITHLEDRIARCIHGNFDHHRVSEVKSLLQKKLRFPA